jgi:gamma-tubulin complex component 3
LLTLGKSLDFIRTMGDPSYCSNEKPCLEYGELNALALSIDTTYKNVSVHLLQLLFRKYELFKHLECIKNYLLLGQGDFVAYLMDSLAETLDKPAVTIYRHNLSGVLEGALRATTTDSSSNLLTKRLDVCLLEVFIGPPPLSNPLF